MPEERGMDMDFARDWHDVAAANLAFAAALYGDVARGAKNAVFAPASLSTALAMTFAGARGQTATEMARVLRLPPVDPARIHAVFEHVASYGRGAPGVELATAGALFGQRGDGLLPAFVALLAERYGAALREVDFAGAPSAASREINAWVSEQTRGKVRDLLPAHVLGALTRLVLVNATYFEGDWADPFDPEQTERRPFHLLGGASSPVQLMTQESRFKHADVEGAQLLELPYRGGAISMVVVLPHARDGLPALEARLAADLARWLGDLDRGAPQAVQVFLPRCRIDTSLSLGDALARLGMPLAFDATKADFSGITGRAGLYLGAVVHAAFVEVDERGTTAAAATAVSMPLAGLGEPPPPRVFRADHPFLFLLRDSRTGGVLFLGRVVAP